MCVLKCPEIYHLKIWWKMVSAIVNNIRFFVMLLDILIFCFWK